MNVRLTLGLLGALLALVVLALVVQGPCSAHRPRESVELLPGFAPSDVAAIRIERPGEAVALRRAGDAWDIGAAGEPADADAAEALVASLARARVAAVVSTNIAKQEGYETDGRRGIVLRVEGQGGKPIAALIVGRRGPDFASSYVRREGKAEVLLVTPDLRLAVSRSPALWRKPAEARK